MLDASIAFMTSTAVPCRRISSGVVQQSHFAALARQAWLSRR